MNIYFFIGKERKALFCRVWFQDSAMALCQDCCVRKWYTRCLQQHKTRLLHNTRNTTTRKDTTHADDRCPMLPVGQVAMVPPLLPEGIEPPVRSCRHLITVTQSWAGTSALDSKCRGVSKKEFVKWWANEERQGVVIFSDDWRSAGGQIQSVAPVLRLPTCRLFIQELKCSRLFGIKAVGQLPSCCQR